jgi:hypothetical protein
MTDFRIFLPITKIDVPKRLVYGTLASETPDKAGERMDYKSSKPHFEKWTKEFQDATAHLGPEGRSAGNLRSMHKPKPAGKFTTLGFDDDGRKIDACAKVTDDDEWRNCLEGVYTGFSIGGSYVGDLWKDADNPGVKWYTAAPVEGSLVDNPANPDAHFSLIKADGSTEERSFAAPGADVSREAEVTWLRKLVESVFGKAAAAAPEPSADDPKVACKAHGVVGCAKCAKAAKAEKRDFSTKEREAAAGTGAAEADGSFPIENESDLRAAIHAYGRSKDKPKTKAHIIARAKALGLSSLIPAGWGGADKAALDDLAKGMQSIFGLTSAFGTIRDAQRSLVVESQGEQDSEDAGLAKRLGAVAKDLAGIISDKSTHEGKEALTMTDIDDLFVNSLFTEVAKGADPGPLLKRFSAGHRKNITKATTRHDKAMKSMKAGLGCLGKAMEAMKRGAVKKAAEPDADDGPDTEEAASQMKKAADNFAASWRAHQKVKKSLTKAASGWVGQAAEAPSKPAGSVFSGYTETKPTSPGEMAGGPIPELGDGSKPDPLLANKGAMPEFVSRHVAELMAKNAVLESQVELMGRMPAPGSGQRPLTFGGAPMVKGGPDANAAILANIKTADPNDNETLNAVACAFGEATADKVAKSVGDPAFHGGALNGGGAIGRA